MSYFLMYCASQNFTVFPSFGYPTIMEQNRITVQPDLQLKNQSQYNPSSTKSIELLCQNDDKKSDSKEQYKKREKKIQIVKKHEKDVQFKQRQQTTNRNLCSNTLKIYFKQLRDKNSETFLNLNKIIVNNNIVLTAQDFLQKVQSLFPFSSTYISFENVKKVCNHFIQHSQDHEFAKILRASIRRFFAYEIFTVNIKSIRTTRKIRNQQIKQGKLFIRELFL